MNHRHYPVKELNRERAYCGPVPFPVRENQMAHGSITLFQSCSCGFERRINVNGSHREVGRWHNPDLGPDMQ